jgi:hypothetical protein
MTASVVSRLVPCASEAGDRCHGAAGDEGRLRSHMRRRPELSGGLMPNRFYFNTAGVDDEAVRLGWSWLLREGNSSAERTGLVAVNSVDTAKRLDRPLGDAGAALAARRSIDIGGVTIVLKVETRWRSTPRVVGAPVLAVWPSESLLNTIEDELRPPLLCVVPWVQGELDAWVEEGALSRCVPAAKHGAPRPSATRSLPLRSRCSRRASRLEGATRISRTSATARQPSRRCDCSTTAATSLTPPRFMRLPPRAAGR